VQIEQAVASEETRARGAVRPEAAMHDTVKMAGSNTIATKQKSVQIQCIENADNIKTL